MRGGLFDELTVQLILDVNTVNARLKDGLGHADRVLQLLRLHRHVDELLTQL